jgi:hypothetical protein
MGLMSYDPDGKPEVTPELLCFASERNLQIVHVICDEPDAEVGDHVGASFMAATPFCPQYGDRIGTPDGRMCEVQRVYYKVVQTGECVLLVPNVLAYLIDGSEEDYRSNHQ